MININLLHTAPKNLDEIRQRIAASIDYFVQVRGQELGLNPEDLKAALPLSVFPKEWGNTAARGAFSFHDYIIQINRKAIYNGVISIEILVFHELTHALDLL